MAIIKTKETQVKPTVFTATAVFLLFAVANALPTIPPQVLCLPVVILCIVSFWLAPWEISLALLFSALGDLSGSCGNLLPQMGFFTTAQIFYIIFFIRRYHRKVEPDRKLTEKAKGYLAMIIFCVIALLVIIFTKIAPEAPSGIIRTGVYIYSVVICTMLITALLQRSMLYAVGALLFVTSDFLLALNMFVQPIPHADIFVLSTYFIAQWLIFVRSTPYRVSHPIHLLRF